MHFRIPFPGGLLKIKHERYLRSVEREGRYPMIKIGSHFCIWIRKVAVPNAARGAAHE